MITARDAIAAGRALLGTPYSELDCINFIKRIIRTAPGGDAKYTTAGTNTLWQSYSASGKYRDLTWRQEGLEGARAGMLSFMRSGDDVPHVGLVTEAGTVLHSSSAKGCVVETALDESWALLAVHRCIEADTGAASGNAPQTDAGKGGNAMNYKATVATQSGPLNMRNMPSTAAARIMQIPRGAAVDVFQEDDGWAYVYYGGETGWVSTAYLERINPDADEAESVEIADGVTAEAVAATTLLREDTEGCITLMGRWRVAQA